MRLVLIRHSKTLPTPDIPIEQWGLTDEGIVEAKALAQDDSIKGLSAIYSSLQTKAIETALYLAKPHGIPIRTDHGLTEATSFTNRFLGEDYERVVSDFLSGKLERVDNGESVTEALPRFNAALSDIAANAGSDDSVGVVSHGTILSLFTSVYSDVSALECHHSIQMPDIAVFDWDAKRFEKMWKGVGHGD